MLLREMLCCLAHITLPKFFFNLVFIILKYVHVWGIYTCIQLPMEGTRGCWIPGTAVSL